ncbi:hypothetical protein EDF60_1595 [Leucobacter luti]|uniref:peptidoglycan-binding domain-containing protein n=1 Tax=Leucobacter luti TaxID=340320 RepID=UPI00104AA812|nr:hypothetical protein [Leucobacter luti]MCW2286949.1 hypothetical protein [Leucobacter luti]TCK41176.1 hypothetical protein EDF60_1595 [Leucobacter luti]
MKKLSPQKEWDSLRPRPRPFLVLSAIWVTPLLAVSAFMVGARVLERESTAPAKDPVTLVGERFSDSRQGVDIEFAIDQPPAAYAASAGIVTGVYVEEGDSIVIGQPIISVDGLPRIAHSAQLPFYRELSLGSSGADVIALIDFLTILNFLSTGNTEGILTGDVESALVQFQVHIGLSPDGVLRPEDFIFFPPSFVQVSELFIQIGGPITTGEPIAFGASVARTANLLAAGTDEPPDEMSGGQTMLVAGDRSMEISSFEVRGGISQTLYTAVIQWVRDGLVREEESSAERVKFSGATLEFAEAKRVGVVPNTSVFGGADGTTCVVEVQRREGKTSHIARATTLVSVAGEIGVTGVDPSLIGKEVLRDTGPKWRKEGPCPS